MESRNSGAFYVRKSRIVAVLYRDEERAENWVGLVDVDGYKKCRMRLGHLESEEVGFDLRRECMTGLRANVVFFFVFVLFETNTVIISCWRISVLSF